MRRDILSRFAFVSAMIATSGCTIMPTQQDVTGLPTGEIVRGVRCETLDAIRGQLAGYLKSLTQDKVAQALGDQLVDRRIPMSQIDLRGLNWPLKRELANYKNYAVAYNFTFDGTVANNLSGGITPFDKFMAGTRDFPFSAHVNRTRQNIQTFGQTDTFGGLLRDTPKEYCVDPYKKRPVNYLYPISGHIGIAQQLNAFLSENELGSPMTAKEGTTNFSATLAFTTTIDGAVNPTIKLEPVLNQTTTSGSYGLSVSRTDIHKLILGFAPSISPLTDREVDAFLAAKDITKTDRVPRRRTIEEDAAEDSVNSNILRFEIGRQPGAVILNQSILSVF